MYIHVCLFCMALHNILAVFSCIVCNFYFVIQDQYHFLHMALVESLMLSSSALPASKFFDAYNELMTFDTKSKCLGFAREFEVNVETWHFSFIRM